MDNRLDPMDPKKRERLIQSAYQEFGENRYEKASTNSIVKRAKISKGLLYHYFSSKRELYFYLCEKAFSLMADAIEKNVDWEKDDLFERIKDVALIKFRIGEQYPYIFPFFTSVYYDKLEMGSETIIEKYSSDLYRRVYQENINYSKFKSDIDVKKAMNMIRWTIEKYGEESQSLALQSDQPTDYKAMIDGIDDYLGILRNAFYREEGEV